MNQLYFWKKSTDWVSRHRLFIQKYQKFGILGVTMPLITVPKLINLHKKLFARNFRVSSCHIQKFSNVYVILNFIQSDQVKTGRATLKHIYVYCYFVIICQIFKVMLCCLMNEYIWNVDTFTSRHTLSLSFQ